MTTYVQVVNLVLGRLREQQVVNVTDSTYSALVASFVNDAKREVEDAWQWSVLLDYIDIPVTAGVSVYNLNNYNGALSGAPLNERARPARDLKTGKFSIFNTTASYEGMLAQAQFDPLLAASASYQNWNVTDQPTQFAFSALPYALRTSGNFNKNLTFYPIPNNTYTIRAAFVNPSDDLVNSTDSIWVPKEPVYQRALMFALYERGEELGETLTMTQEKFKMCLADAVTHDQSLQAPDAGFSVDDVKRPAGYYSGWFSSGF